MTKTFFSNSLLGLGTMMLIVFVFMELAGWPSNPLLPALSALSIGGTAVLDRVGRRGELE